MRTEWFCPEKVIGTYTTAAMQSGIYYGYLELIRGITARIKAERNNPDMLVIATGGLAKLYGSNTQLFDHIDPELTIRGLQLIYQHNEKTKQS